VADEFVKRRGDTEWFHSFFRYYYSDTLMPLDNFSAIGVNKKIICLKWTG